MIVVDMMVVGVVDAMEVVHEITGGLPCLTRISLSQAKVKI